MRKDMKTYVVPKMRVCEADCSSIIAQSIQDGFADDSDVLVHKQVDWDDWDEEEQLNTWGNTWGNNATKK